MKKFNIAWFIMCALLSNSVFAYISGKEKIEEKMFYCPSEVTCSKVDVGLNCTFTSDTSQLWSTPTATTVTPPAGIYKFYDITAPYESPDDSSVAYCRYTIPTDNTVIYLTAKNEAGLEAYYEKTANWIWSPPANARCVSNSPQSCPLKDKHALVIYNKDIFSDIIVSVRKLNIKTPIRIFNYRSITFDDLSTVGCSSSKQCTISFSSPKGYFYGSITVDMDNNLKILSIDAAHPLEFRMNQIDSFNAVVIGYNRDIRRKK